MRSSNADITVLKTLLNSKGLTISATKLDALKRNSIQLDSTLKSALQLNAAELLTEPNFAALLAKDNKNYIGSIEAALVLLNNTGKLTQAKVKRIFSNPEKAIEMSTQIMNEEKAYTHKIYELLYENGYTRHIKYDFIVMGKMQQYVGSLYKNISKLISADILSDDKLDNLFAHPEIADQTTADYLKREKVLAAIYSLVRFLFLYNQEFWEARLKYSALGGVEVEIRGNSYKVPARAEKIIKVLLEQNPEGSAYENLKAICQIPLSASQSLTTSKKTTGFFESFEDLRIEELDDFRDVKKLLQARRKLIDFMKAHEDRYGWMNAYKEFLNISIPDALIDIFKTFLNITPEQSTHFLKLMVFEGRWNLALKDIRSESDVIKFVHEKIAKKIWLKGFEYTALSHRSNDFSMYFLQNYYNLFKGMGLLDALNYPAPTAPFVSVVLEGSVKDVANSVDSLGEDIHIRKMLAPRSGKIIGITSARELAGEGFFDEASMKYALMVQKLKPTAMNMLNYLVQNKLKYQVKSEGRSDLSFVEVITEAANAANPNMDEIGNVLKASLESRFDLKNVPKPIAIAVYAPRHSALSLQLHLQKSIGKDFAVTCVSPELTVEEFNRSPKSISQFLAEIAKLIHFNYINNLANYTHRLEADELNQLLLELERQYELSDYSKLEIEAQIKKVPSLQEEAEEIVKNVKAYERYVAEKKIEIRIAREEQAKRLLQQAHPSQLLFKPEVEAAPAPEEKKQANVEIKDDLEMEPNNKRLP